MTTYVGSKLRCYNIHISLPWSNIEKWYSYRYTWISDEKVYFYTNKQQGADLNKVPLTMWA